MNTPPRPRGGQCGTFAPGGSGGEGGCGSSAFGRARRRGHQGDPYTRAPATVTSPSQMYVQGSFSKHSPVPPPGEVAVARDADDRRAGLGRDALEPGREHGLEPRHLASAPPSSRRG